MAELVMLADIHRTVYPEEVTRQLPVMAQARESLQTDVLTNCATPPTYSQGPGEPPTEVQGAEPQLGSQGEAL